MVIASFSIGPQFFSSCSTLSFSANFPLLSLGHWSLDLQYSRPLSGHCSSSLVCLDLVCGTQDPRSFKREQVFAPAPLGLSGGGHLLMAGELRPQVSFQCVCVSGLSLLWPPLCLTDAGRGGDAGLLRDPSFPCLQVHVCPYCSGGISPVFSLGRFLLLVICCHTASHSVG